MTEPVPPEAVLTALRAARGAEKSQTVFYRALALDAEAAGDPATAERLNGLLADEQHHLSRISARLLEWGQPLAGPADGESGTSGRRGNDGRVDESIGPVGGADRLAGWETAARTREHGEIERYEAILELALDERTRDMIVAFLDAERSHAESLGGKWMGAEA